MILKLISSLFSKKQKIPEPVAVTVKVFVADKIISLDNPEYVINTPLCQLREEGIIPENCIVIGSEITYSDGTKKIIDTLGRQH